jgi:hypothetical protein
VWVKAALGVEVEADRSRFDTAPPDLECQRVDCLEMRPPRLVRSAPRLIARQGMRLPRLSSTLPSWELRLPVDFKVLPA